MNLERILDTERAAATLEARLTPLLERDMGNHLNTLRFWAAEIRHFAICWDDSVKAQADNQMTPEQAEAYRQASIDRLVQTFRPN